MCSYDRDMRTILAIPLLAFAIALTPAATAQGQWGNSFSSDRGQSNKDRANMPLSKVFQKLKQRYGGRQRNARLQNRGGQQVYVVDWITGKGEFITVTVDAKTGRVLS